MHEGHELIHALPEPLGRPELVQQLDYLRDEEERVSIGRVPALALERGPDGREYRLRLAREDQEGGGAGHVGR